MIGEKEMLFLGLIVILLIFNNVSLLISYRKGAKHVKLMDILKSKDYVLYILLLEYFLLPLNAIIAVVQESYITILLIVGFISMFFGITINFVARKELSRYWTPFSEQPQNSHLVKTGIYSRVRHPIYLSGFIYFFGLVLVAGNLYGVILFLIFISALAIRIVMEEKQLNHKFGIEYRIYSKETPVIVPRVFTRR